MSENINVKRGPKPKPSKKTKAQRQADCFREYEKREEQRLRDRLKDKREVVAIESDKNKVNVTFTDESVESFQVRFKKASWLTRDWYFRTINKGARVSLLHQQGFKADGSMVFMVFTEKKKVLMSAKQKKRLHWWKAYLSGNMFLERRKKTFI
jgi:hypothetical protein